MLSLHGVDASYGAIRALRGVSLEVQEGEIVALIGSNGAGKSTTLMAVSGVVPVRAGRILFREVPIHRLRPDRIVGLGLSQVPEGRRIFQDLTVQENLDMGAYLRKDHQGISEDRDYIFGLFPVLAERRHQLGGTLSGGEQQMLAISRALMARPALLLLDEPSMGLAPKVITRIFGIIRRINAEHGTTIFLVEQNANLALKVAHRGYVMEHGQVVLEDSAEGLMSNDDVRKSYLGI